MTSISNLIAAVLAIVRSKLFMAFVAGGVACFILAGTYASVVDYTNTLGFCAHTCHEMESTVYQEYRESRHFSNEQGVVVRCSQCHVPHDDWFGTLITKTLASFELWGHFTGSINTPEKFEARRLHLARRVWAQFEANNARNCRSCHAYENMLLDAQRTSVRAEHTDAMGRNANCLECHQGITHHLPEGMEEEEPDIEDLQFDL